MVTLELFSATSHLTLAVTVQFEVDISVERRDVGNSLQLPVLLVQTLDGDDGISHLKYTAMRNPVN